MELTAEKFRQFVEAPAATAAPSEKREQRRTPHTRLTMYAALMPFSDRFDLETIVAPVRDISCGGFGFLHDHPVPLGEQFALVLPDEGGHTMAILCTVAYWQPIAENLFAIGARFCRVLREGQADLPLIFEDAVSGERLERMAS